MSNIKRPEGNLVVSQLVFSTEETGKLPRKVVPEGTAIEEKGGPRLLSTKGVRKRWAAFTGPKEHKGKLSSKDTKWDRSSWRGVEKGAKRRKRALSRISVDKYQKKRIRTKPGGLLGS